MRGTSAVRFVLMLLSGLILAAALAWNAQAQTINITYNAIGPFRADTSGQALASRYADTGTGTVGTPISYTLGQLVNFPSPYNADNCSINLGVTISKVTTLGTTRSLTVGAGGTATFTAGGTGGNLRSGVSDSTNGVAIAAIGSTSSTITMNFTAAGIYYVRVAPTTAGPGTPCAQTFPAIFTSNNLPATSSYAIINVSDGSTTPPPTVTFNPDSGYYYNAAQGGRGFSLERNSADRIFFASYGYEDGGAGRAIWLVATLSRTAGTNNFTGSMLQVTNGQVLGGNPVTNPTVTDRGAMTLAFTSTTAARLTWPASFGAAPAVDLVRYPITGSTVTSPNGGLLATTGWWSSSAEPGRGYFTEVQGNTMFLATYMYRTDGSAVWYVASGAMTGSNLFSSTISEFQGGPGFLNPGRTGATAVATANNVVTMQWSSTSAATITIGGRQVAVTRYSF